MGDEFDGNRRSSDQVAFTVGAPLHERNAPAGTIEDRELLRACSEFHVAHVELDRLLEDDVEPDETELYCLNKQWKSACLWAISLRATTPVGLHAKAQMLLAVINVTLGGDERGYDLHELLAASLARDC